MLMKMQPILLGRIIVGMLLCHTTSTAQADNQLVEPKQALSSVTADWNSDGSFDRAVLIDSGHEDGADLYIYLSEDDDMKLAIHRPGFAWKGAMWGMQPKLNLNKRGSLLIHTENTGIGRSAWNQKLTVAWRDGQFIVAGYTYDSYDRLDPNNVTNCDLNLLTGKGNLNNKPIKSPVKKVPLTKWNDQTVQGVCFEE